MHQIGGLGKAEREKLFIVPASEQNPAKVKRILTQSKLSIGIGLGVTVTLLAVWVIPYLKAL